ncbi:hypothetical protein OG422_19650 [Streptomyces sp. NBC_01525]|uniref:hypothetical protein n=1 Tax=Streptomyces sp. NBC_01525 TaxID=2903893 RepID=UPI0038691F90
MTEKASSALAVLYICAARRDAVAGVAEERAVQEGRDFAATRGLKIVTVITDPFGDPVPQRRSGWLRVREMAEQGEVEVVIVRWPNALSVDHERRYPEMKHLCSFGCQLLFSWAPLADAVGLRGTW